jgi:Domain of unknown function (DUF1995)
MGLGRAASYLKWHNGSTTTVEAMSELPRTFDETLIELAAALERAQNDGKQRLQVDIRIPGLEMMTLLQAIAPLLGTGWVALFPDPGAAALARKKLGTVDYALRGLSEMRSGVEQYSALLLVEPSAIEVELVESVAGQAVGKPVILLNSRLEESGVVGIGLAGRQLRERFLSTIEVIYAIQPFEAGALYRSYPNAWQLWKEEQDGDYSLVNEMAQRPSGEDIDKAFQPKGEGLLDGLRRFLRAIGN